MPTRARPRTTDVHLYRTADGTAAADVYHFVQHSPTGFEWGYAGSGPADLALAILTAFAPSAGPKDRVTMADGSHCSRLAWQYHHAFKEDFVAGLPRSGGVILAADARAWIAMRRGQD